MEAEGRLPYFQTMNITVMLSIFWAPNAIIRQSYCGPGWTYVDNTNACYKAIKEKTYSQNEQKCKGLAGHLVSIHSKEENEFVMGLTNLSNTWIGGHMHESQNGRWSYLDSTMPNYDNWDEGEPELLKGCIQMGSNGRWKLVNCSQIKNKGVCKKKLLNKCLSEYEFYLLGGCQKVTLQKRAKCEPGWMYFQKTDSCYKIFEEAGSVNKAKSVCQSNNAYLASIHSKEENSFITILGSSHKGGTTLTGFHHKSKLWSNLDGSSADYDNWALDEPSHDDENNGCTEIFLEKKVDNHRWAEYPCNVKNMNFVCKKNSTEMVWEPGWSYFNVTGYSYKEMKNANFNEAEVRCLAERAHLSSIRSLKENSFIAELVDNFPNKHDHTWVGARSSEEHRNDNRESKPRNNADGTPYDFHNWSSYTWASRFDCISMFTNEKVDKRRAVGSWNDIACGDKDSNYVCKKKARY